jgi:GNAT superfamily N-acetyltransferase
MSSDSPLQSEPIFREATPDDIPALRQLIAVSARALCAADYAAAQIEAAIGTAWGVDTQLIRDQTYFAVAAGADIVACGGWSRRRTLFGGDEHSTREPELLDPQRDAARIRAFFVHPAWTRRSLGRMLLERCEREARAAGFRAAELVATLPGQRLYRACGYVGERRVAYPLPSGQTIDFVPMTKRL